jgi:hypothetical protein
MREVYGQLPALHAQIVKSPPVIQANVTVYDEFNRVWHARAQSYVYPAKPFKTAFLRKASPATVK